MPSFFSVAAAFTTGAIVSAAWGQSADASGLDVFLRYLNAPLAGGELHEPPHLTLSLVDRQLRAVMDTGSTGVVVSAYAIPGFEQLPKSGPATLTYTSSGR